MPCRICGGEATGFSWLLGEAWANGEGDVDICSRCRDAYDFARCIRCDGYVLREDTIDGYCPTCASFRGLWNEDEPLPTEVVRDHDALHHCQRRLFNWDYRPLYTYYHMPYEKGELLYLGLELEAEFARDADGNYSETEYRQHCSEIYRVLPEWMYAKYDSSVHPGMELVLHPMTMRYLQDSLPNLDTLMQTLLDNHFSAYAGGRAGMHIHMSVAAFGSTHLWKFMSFIYDNQELVVFLSGRTGESLRHWANMEIDESELKRSCVAKYSIGHHTAVNLSPHHKTVELRIFKGTLNPLMIRRNIEIAHSIYQYTKDVSVKEMSLDGWINYVQKNYGQFLVLNFFIKLPEDMKHQIFDGDGPPDPALYEELVKQQAARKKKHALVLSVGV